MSGLDVLGGVGAGLMKGQKFVAERNENQARLGILQDEAKRKQQDWQRQEDERLRLENINRIHREVDADKSFTNDWDRSLARMERSRQYYTAPEIQLARENSEKAYNLFGEQAINAYTANGDIAGLQKILDVKQPGFRLSIQDGKLFIVAPDGQARLIGGRKELGEMFALANVVKREEEREKQALEKRKIESGIGLAELQGQHLASQDRIAQGQLALAQSKAGQEKVPEQVRIAKLYAEMTPEDRAIFDHLNAAKRTGKSPEEQKREFIADLVKNNLSPAEARKLADETFGQVGQETRKLPDGRTVVMINGQAYVVDGNPSTPASVAKPAPTPPPKPRHIPPTREEADQAQKKTAAEVKKRLEAEKKEREAAWQAWRPKNILPKGRGGIHGAN
jgi:hypothetical protein